VKIAFICSFLLCLLISFHFNKIFHEKIKIDNIYNISIPLVGESLTFNIINPKLYSSSKNNMMKIYYNIQVFDSKYDCILPSDFTLKYNLHLLCFLEISNSININSLAAVEKDKYFKCTEFSRLNENIKLGIIVYKNENERQKIKNSISYYISQKIFHHFNPINDDDIFNFSKINNEYSLLLSRIQNNSSLIDTKRLKKLYISKPILKLKRDSVRRENKWNFINIFNDYFCLCKGFNCLNLISSKCKYYFYLYLIDINRNVYEKTDFFLMDFIFKKYSADDVYPIFEEMINQNLRAHYYTEKEEIYNEYCQNEKYCDVIVHADEKNYKINDEFLEKHLSLILKLKHVLTAQRVGINFINNAFYNIDYITYICIGHGVSYFKYYLYENFYGPQNFDKLLLPGSEKLISVAKNYGWKDENIIKLNLPRWDKYYKYNKSSIQQGNIKQNSIFIMFTWRLLKKFRKVSSYYIRNILNLLKNEQLINVLLKKNLILYFSIHHEFLKYENIFKSIINIKNIIYIKEKDVAECLLKTNLLVSDFSSIIFDMIYRKKPFIIFIPDANDTNIENIYKSSSYNIIKNFSNNYFKFENINFDINSTVNKIIYYIDNDFRLDTKLKNFYDEFNFTIQNISTFINYLLKL